MFLRKVAKGRYALPVHTGTYGIRMHLSTGRMYQ